MDGDAQLDPSGALRLSSDPIQHYSSAFGAKRTSDEAAAWFGPTPLTHLRHWPDRNPAVQQPPLCQLRLMVENRLAFLTVSHQFDILRLRPLMLGLDERHYLADRGPERAQLDRDIDRLSAASRRHGAGADHQR
jgi:hypothetical protein